MNIFGDKIQDYEILEHLGKGGFAHVYRAKCRKTGLYVAIKMIDKALMASAGMIGRVRQEVTIHSRLKHPAILELYTFFEDIHYVYLVLELAHNGELAKHFKLGTTGLSEKAASDIFGQVVHGVLYLHTHNIIHRDLSLNNLLLTKDLKVKIADFGLATQLNGPDEKHVTMCGTPNYISPEVASRELHGLPADVWGLGCMLYTLLVGRPPFHTQHVKTTLNRVINADYRIPHELSFYAQDLLQKLLCKDPTKRITLKEIIEHPFVTHAYPSTPVCKHEMSRDSGFLTTLHSTQHSGKIKRTNSDHMEYCSESNSPEVHQTPNNHRGEAFKIFSSHSTGSLRVNNHRISNCQTAAYKENDFYCTPKSALSQSTPLRTDTPLLSDSGRNVEMNVNRAAPSFSVDCSENNKENVGVACNVKPTTIGVPPLCADRLPSITHRTRNALLKIEEDSVVVEFIKKRGKDREERVVEVCNISKDGMKVAISSFPNGKDTATQRQDEMFSYHNLPQKHWKKYLYASKFVDLVKAKTPKITLYTNLAKCQLMENNVDIEMFFYSGEKVTYSSEGLKVIDRNTKTHHNAKTNPELAYLCAHFEECSNRMNRTQAALSSIPDECFPLIIGKRPIHPNVVASPQQAGWNFQTPQMNYESFQRTNASSTKAPSDYNA